jgi:hypothetical protein
VATEIWHGLQGHRADRGLEQVTLWPLTPCPPGESNSIPDTNKHGVSGTKDVSPLPVRKLQVCTYRQACMPGLGTLWSPH